MVIRAKKENKSVGGEGEGEEGDAGSWCWGTVAILEE